MKEEEIIIILKDMIGCDRKEYNSTQVYAIQGLLNLYEKSKEDVIKQYELGLTQGAYEKNLVWEDKIRELAKKYEYAANGYDCTTASYKESQDIGKYLAYIELLNKEDQGNE